MRRQVAFYIKRKVQRSISETETQHDFANMAALRGVLDEVRGAVSLVGDLRSLAIFGEYIEIRLFLRVYGPGICFITGCFPLKKSSLGSTQFMLIPRQQTKPNSCSSLGSKQNPIHAALMADLTQSLNFYRLITRP